MNYLRTQLIRRLTDLMKVRLNGNVWETQSILNIQAGRNIEFAQTETHNVSTLTVSAGTQGVFGYWGAFWDSTDQTVTSTTATYVVALGSANANNDGVSVTSGDRITFAHDGVYNVATSMQFVNTDSQAYLAYVWFRKNGVDIADSASRFSVPSKHGSSDGSLIFYVNLMEKCVAGDYMQVAWSAGSTQVSLQHYAAAAGPPAIPAIPSVIVTANQV
jgi:plastocyanin